jgi:hypothetical protein
VAPEGFYAVYCGTEELEELSATLNVPLVALLGLDGDLEGSIFTVETFVGVLLGEMG